MFHVGWLPGLKFELRVNFGRIFKIRFLIIKFKILINKLKTTKHTTKNQKKSKGKWGGRVLLPGGGARRTSYGALIFDSLQNSPLAIFKWKLI